MFEAGVGGPGGRELDQAGGAVIDAGDREAAGGDGDVQAGGGEGVGDQGGTADMADAQEVLDPEQELHGETC